MSRDFKNIKAWQHSDDLVFRVYAKTKNFPKEELYGLTSQLRRAAISVPTNIAEGASRQHKHEYLQFLYVARDSLVETEYPLHIPRRLDYLTDAEYKNLDILREETAKFCMVSLFWLKRKVGFHKRFLHSL
jgi:four helix bundle protein